MAAELLQSVHDRVCRYCAAYRAELFCAAGVAVLVLFGLCRAPWWGYALALAVLAMLVLTCNPLHIWDGLLPPKARALMAAGILVALLPVSFDGVAPLAKAALWALAAGMEAVALWRRKLWMGLWRIRQSPDVDRVLAHLSHEGDWEAGRAWEQYGCRETRALLHQTLWAECSEQEMGRTYLPVYLLGYLHGSGAEQRRGRKAETDRAALEDQARTLRAKEEELAALRSDNAALAGELEQARYSAETYQARATLLEQRVQELQLDPEARDAAILAYVEAGHTYTEAGAKYGLTKAGAVSAARRARDKEANHG